MNEGDASASSSQLSKSQSPPSRRWTHFHSALQLAIQRAAHKWTYEEFSECFELWCKEQPDGASAIFNTISTHMETNITNACNELFEKYNARENIDILHAVVTEARARQKAGEQPGEDTWRANLEPRAAVRARTIPILADERDRLKRELKKLETENLDLQAQIVENVESMEANDAEESRRLDLLDELEAKWSSLPIEDIQDWTLQLAETQTTKPVG